MDITELLETPDGAVLAAIGGEVALVTMRHETVNKVTIERFPLGAVAGVDAVLSLLGAHGFANREPAIAAAPVETPALPAPDGVYVCPECGRSFAKTTGLGSHRKVVHGIAGKGGYVAAPGDFACPDCPQTFAKPRALSMHRFRVHGVQQEPRRAPITGDHACTDCEARFETEMALDMHQMKMHRVPPPTAFAVVAAVAAPVTPETLEPPPPVSLDVTPTSESHSALPTKDRKVRAMIADGSCPVCHEPLLTHESCDGCGVLIGPEHVTTHGVFVSGATYCRDCAEARIAARRAELVAA
jgi:hypothetical protein